MRLVADPLVDGDRHTGVMVGVASKAAIGEKPTLN
jgi:hypothetical protein